MTVNGARMQPRAMAFGVGLSTCRSGIHVRGGTPRSAFHWLCLSLRTSNY